MTLQDSKNNMDPLLRNRRSLPDHQEDRSEHLWWNANADLIERLWAHDSSVRLALRAEYLGKARGFLTKNVSSDDIIFELGSGSGWVGRVLVEGTKNCLLGIDLSEAQVEISKKNAEAEGLSMQCTYVRANLSDSGSHINEHQTISGLLIHAILHHLTWSEIDQIFIDAVRLGPEAKLFAYEPVFFRQLHSKKKPSIVGRLSRLLAVFSVLCVLFLMRLFGLVTRAARDQNLVTRLDQVSREAAANQWVLSPKEVVFDHKELLDTLEKNYIVKRSYLCNYSDMSAATTASILHENSRQRCVYLKFFIPALRILDRWLVSSGAIYELCSGNPRWRLINRFFPRYCFWGVECLPKNV